jgi:hypothetical protein
LAENRKIRKPYCEPHRDLAWEGGEADVVHGHDGPEHLAEAAGADAGVGAAGLGLEGPGVPVVVGDGGGGRVDGVGLLLAEPVRPLVRIRRIARFEFIIVTNM